MHNLNPFAISGLLIVIVCLPLFFLILLKGKTKISLLFSVHVLSVLLWGLGAFIVGINTNPDVAIHLWRFAKVPVFFIVTTLLHTVLALEGKYPQPIIFLAYLQSLYFVILNAKGKLIISTKLMFGNIYYYQGSATYLVYFTLWVLMAAFANLELFLYFRKTYPKQRKQILFLLIGITIGFLGGTTNFLPGLGVNIYPYGNFLIPIYFLIVSYAILKHQFLDIAVVIKKSLVYSVLIATISLFYILIVLLLERLLQNIVGYNSVFVSTSVAFVLGILIIPFRNRIQTFIDKYFFKGSHMQIAEENARLKQELMRGEKLKAVATLSSGLAHEIKNPLTALKTFSEFLPQRLEDKDFLLRFSKIVGSEVSRIDGLVHQLLEFSKPTPLQLKPTDINQLTGDTLDFLNSKFIDSKIDLHKEFCNYCPILQIDPSQFKQALLNIILNAIEAMKGGGILSVETRIKGLEDLGIKGAAAENPQILNPFTPYPFEIIITDTGCGIDEKDLPHIFDPFFSKKDGGTGLGLAITHGIIQEHGGKIRVKSVVGKGAEFVLEIPLSYRV